MNPSNSSPVAVALGCRMLRAISSTIIVLEITIGATPLEIMRVHVKHKNKKSGVEMFIEEVMFPFYGTCHSTRSHESISTHGTQLHLLHADGF